MPTIGTLIVYSTNDIFVNNTVIDEALCNLDLTPNVMCHAAEAIGELVPVHVVLDEDKGGLVDYCEFQFRACDASTIAEKLGSDETLSRLRAFATEPVSPQISPRIKGGACVLDVRDCHR